MRSLSFDKDWELSGGSGVHAKALRPGDRIDGKYLIHRTLGAGGWAVVYEAEHVVMKHRVAVKVLRPDDDSQALALERFKREARLSASIRHRNVLEVYDVGNLFDGSPYLVMDLLRGEDLDTRLAAGPFHVAEVLDVGDQLMSALAALASAGIIHRDIKPHNLFLHEDDDGDLVLKLLDFGIAREDDASCQPASRLTTKGELLGTPHYMAPEQLRNEPVDCRTDLYAASVVLWELLAGVTPFDERTQGALIASVLRDPVPDLGKYRPDCPVELIALIERGLDKDIEKRWLTPQAMQAEIRRIRDALGYPSGADAWSPAARAVSLPLLLARSQETVDRPEIDVHGPTLDEREIDESAKTLARPSDASLPPRLERSVRWGRRAALTLSAALTLTLPLGLWSASEAGASNELAKAVAIEDKTARHVETAAEVERAAEPDEDTALASVAPPSDVAVAPAPESASRIVRTRTAPRVTPESPARLRQQALAAYVRGQLPRARVLFRRALATDRNDAEAWRGLGVVASAMGRDDEARQAFRRYLHLVPTAADAPQVRARLASL